MKYIFVTGGVVSGLGKGISAASIGRLLKARGYKVTAQKLDPYINVDPGTMSPFQHGEVFVTDDGLEADLDLGHYERFIDEVLTPLKLAKPFRYQAFDCKTMQLTVIREIMPNPITIIEGSYSCHPAFGDFYDLQYDGHFGV